MLVMVLELASASSLEQDFFRIFSLYLSLEFSFLSFVNSSGTSSAFSGHWNQMRSSGMMEILMLMIVNGCDFGC